MNQEVVQDYILWKEATKKWEYKTMKIYDGFVDNKQLQEMGMDGWELVVSISSPNKMPDECDDFVLIFKRPL